MYIGNNILETPSTLALIIYKNLANSKGDVSLGTDFEAV